MSEASTKQCPSCGQNRGELLKVDAGMRLRLQETGVANPPSEVCSNCFKSLGSNVSQGAQLRAHQHARDQQRMIMWKNRVQLVRQAKIQMNQRSFSEAAVLYEKYLKILELIYDAKPGTLSPAVINSKARQKELTVIVSAYWDLVRIYDTSPRYGDRQKKTIEKLLEFLTTSTLSPQIIDQAKVFAKTAKNPDLIRDFVQKAERKSGRCFVATVVLQETSPVSLSIFYAFRNEVLASSRWGRALIWIYYKLSPPVAGVLRKLPSLQTAIRPHMIQFANWLARRFNLQMN